MSPRAYLPNYCFHATRRLKSTIETLQKEVAKDPNLKSEQGTKIKLAIELADKLESIFLGLSSEFIDSDMGRREIKPSDPEYILIKEMIELLA